MAYRGIFPPFGEDFFFLKSLPLKLMTVPSFHIRLKNRQPLVGGLNVVVSLIIPAIRRQRQENHVQGQGLERGLSQEKAPGTHRNGKV